MLKNYFAWFPCTSANTIIKPAKYFVATLNMLVRTDKDEI